MPEYVNLSDEKVLQVTDPAEAMRLLAKTQMRPFTKEDWCGFAGCETKSPTIGEYGDFIIVQDGVVLNIIHTDDGFGGTVFKLEKF